MRKPRRIDFNPDNFLAGVTGLMSEGDLGVYWLVCSLIYSKRRPIDDDPSWLARFFKNGHWRSVKASVERLVVMGKITRQEGGKLMVMGCAEPLEDAVTRVASATQNGRKGGRPTNENNDLEKPAGSSEKKLLPLPLPLPITPIAPKGDFERWYAVYPLKKNPDAAERAFKAALKRGATVEDLIASALRYAEEKADDLADKTRRRFVMHPATWLNGGAWKSEPEPETAALDAVDSLLSLWTGRMRMWRSDKTWLGSWGPEPGQPQCQVPRELLLEPTAAGGML